VLDERFCSNYELLALSGTIIFGSAAGLSLWTNMVVRMNAVKSSSFSIDALLGNKPEKISSNQTTEKMEEAERKSPSESSPKETIPDSTSIASTTPFNPLLYSANQATFMEPIYRTDAATRETNSAAMSPFLSAYGWTTLAAFHENSVRAAATMALAGNYIPGLFSQSRLSEADWGKLIGYSLVNEPYVTIEWNSGIAQWLERLARDQTILSSRPGHAGFWEYRLLTLFHPRTNHEVGSLIKYMCRST